MESRLAIPHDAIRDFCRTHGVREFALFGSALRNDFGADSDIDVLIDLAPEARVGLIGLQKMQGELTRIFGRPVDLLTRNGLNRHIRGEILRQAKVIHEE